MQHRTPAPAGLSAWPHHAFLTFGCRLICINALQKGSCKVLLDPWVNMRNSSRHCARIAQVRQGKGQPGSGRLRPWRQTFAPELRQGAVGRCWRPAGSGRDRFPPVEEGGGRRRGSAASACRGAFGARRSRRCALRRPWPLPRAAAAGRCRLLARGPCRPLPWDRPRGRGTLTFARIVSDQPPAMLPASGATSSTT